MRELHCKQCGILVITLAAGSKVRKGMVRVIP